MKVTIELNKPVPRPGGSDASDDEAREELLRQAFGEAGAKALAAADARVNFDKSPPGKWSGRSARRRGSI